LHELTLRIQNYLLSQDDAFINTGETKLKGKDKTNILNTPCNQTRLEMRVQTGKKKDLNIALTAMATVRTGKSTLKRSVVGPR
jgi:hypothetical protein